MSKLSATDEVIAINPDTGKPCRMTRKAFDGVYKEKGFELVDRDNAEKATPAAAGRASGKSQRATGGTKVDDADDNDGDKGSLGSGGGAASIAKNLEL